MHGAVAVQVHADTANAGVLHGLELGGGCGVWVDDGDGSGGGAQVGGEGCEGGAVGAVG